MEGHDRSTEVAGHHKGVERVVGAADSVVADKVAAWVPPPANTIKQCSIRGDSLFTNLSERITSLTPLGDTWQGKVTHTTKAWHF